MAVGNKGNINAKGNLGNEGGRPIKRLQNLSPEAAGQQAEDINHSARSHPDVQDQAFNHLHTLDQHVSQLAETSLNMHAHVAKMYMDSAKQAHSGFTPGSAVPHVKSVKDMLNTLTSEGESSPHLDAAHSAADSYLKTMGPAKSHKSVTVPGTESVSMSPDYRKKVDRAYAVKQAQNERAIAKAKEKK